MFQKSVAAGKWNGLNKATAAVHRSANSLRHLDSRGPTQGTVDETSSPGEDDERLVGSEGREK